MIFDYFIVLIAVLYLIFASVSDIRKREVPDWLTYTLITLALASRLIYSLSINDFYFFIAGIFGFVIFFAIACIMYYSRQWGGGDAKLLMGLGALFGSWPGIFSQNIFWPFKIPFPHLLTLLVNILFAGALYGIIAILFLMLRDWKNFKTKFREVMPNHLPFFVIFILILIEVVVLITNYPVILIVSIFLVFILLLILLFYIAKAVEETSMKKKVPVSELTEGDWPVNDVIVNKKIICRADSLGLEADDIKLLKKSKTKFVWIKEGLPFIPAFLIGYLITLFLGNLLNYLI